MNRIIKSITNNVNISKINRNHLSLIFPIKKFSNYKKKTSSNLFVLEKNNISKISSKQIKYFLPSIFPSLKFKSYTIQKSITPIVIPLIIKDKYSNLLNKIENDEKLIILLKEINQKLNSNISESELKEINSKLNSLIKELDFKFKENKQILKNEENYNIMILICSIISLLYILYMIFT
jgi:hypothetical protein